MRISDWSSDVCSSDLVEFVQRREIGKVERIAFVIGEADPVIDRDDELLRMIWFGRGERIVGNGDGYGGRLDHLVYRCKARRLAEHHVGRSEEHTSELQSLMRISYAVFCLKKKKKSKRTLSS